MKKIILLVAFVLTTVTFAQEKITEGVLTQTQTMSSPNEEVNGQLAMMGEMLTTVYFKGADTRSEMSSPMMGSTVTIVDDTNSKMMMLLDHPMMGKKYVTKELKTSEEDLKNIIVTPKNDTKTILGYECVGYDVVMKKEGQEMKVVVYATEKLKISGKKNIQFGDKVKGFPMYTEMNINQMGADIKIIIKVASIKAEKVDTAKFDMTIPAGYEKAENLPGM